MPKKKADPITTSEPEFSNQALNESSAIESASPNEAMPPTETVPTEAIDSIDTSLISAVWVLLDFIDQVSFHSAGDYPAKIIFYVDGEIYEILYAGFGNEALVTYLTSLQSHSDYSHIILLDSPEQIKELDIPNTCGYCTVSPTGRVRYYQKT